MSHPKHHKGHLIVEDLDEGPGILSLETGEHTPITFQEQEHKAEHGMSYRQRTYHAGEHKDSSEHALLRKFADEKHKERQGEHHDKHHQKNLVVPRTNDQRYDQHHEGRQHEGQHRNAEHQEGQSQHGADEEIADLEKMLQANREVMDAAEHLLEKMKEAAGK